MTVPTVFIAIVVVRRGDRFVLVEETRDRGLTEIFGSAGLRLSAEFRLGLTGKGREWASEALAQSLYVGPAPVSLAMRLVPAILL